jgi:hypothetical protein
MKKILILFCAVLFAFASDFIPLDRLQAISQEVVAENFGLYDLVETVTYYGLDEQPNAYALIYQNNEGNPLTLIMGARYTTTPIGEISKSLPRSKSMYEKILQQARGMTFEEPEFQKIYYFGPGEEYCSFNTAGRDILINACDFKSMDKNVLFSCNPKPNPELEAVLREKWDRYLNGGGYGIRQDSGYVANVPFIDWVYGCTPCASSMVFWYWDEFAPSAGYGNLVDHFYTHYDTPEAEWNDCANVNRELALAMYTDTLSGSSSVGSITPGQITVANYWHGYSCTSYTPAQGTAGNQYQFAYIKGEIDAGRPFNWSVIQYYSPDHGERINHSVTAVGYHIILPDTFVQVHNTWDGLEPLWILWTYYGGVYSWDWVSTFVPGGWVEDNIFLDWPVGATLTGGALSPRAIVYAGVTYRLRWHTQGSGIDHVKISYSTGRDGEGYDSLQWTLIDASAPNTGEYLWMMPDDDTLRVNLVGLSSGNVRLAADGSFGRCVPTLLDHSAEVNVVGHIPTLEGFTRDVELSGDYLYIADGDNGLVVADVTEPGVPEVVGHLDLPGHAYSLDVVGGYVYLGDQEDTLRVISVSDPENPVEVGKCAVGSEALDVFAVGSNVFVAARTEGLVVVSVATPSVPGVIGQWDTDGFSYDVYVDGSYAYVADATKGVRVIDVSDPENPDEVGYYDTNGISYGVTKSGGYVYCADGTQGVKVFDASSPDTLLLLGSFDTPVAATKVRKLGSAVYVADGAAGGLRVIDVSDPGSMSELGYIGSKGTSGSLWMSGDSLVYLADGLTGVMVIDRDGLRVAERDLGFVSLGFSVMPSFGRVSDSYTVSFSVSYAVDVSVRLFDCVGRYVEDVYCGRLAEGVSDVSWRPRHLPAGIYFMQVEAGDVKDIQKLILVK